MYFSTALRRRNNFSDRSLSDAIRFWPSSFPSLFFFFNLREKCRIDFRRWNNQSFALPANKCEPMGTYL